MKTTELEDLVSVSQNNLTEMQNLIYRIDDLVNNTFLHITDKLPPTFVRVTIY